VLSVRRIRVAVVGVLVALSAVACEPAPPPQNVALTPSFDTLLKTAAPGFWRATGEDRIEVWVCHVPTDTTAALYRGLPIRRTFRPTELVTAMSPRLTRYFDAISHSRYHPVLIAGGEVSMAAGDEPQRCVDEAIRRAGANTRVVLAIADAEHGADQPGGFGSGGNPCKGAAPCPVSASHRWAYVGAADFSPDWGSDPPMDLVEHELGHTLGWVHSGSPASGRAAGMYDSALDVMSDSAAPRATDPSRRDAPDTLAISRVAAGWLTVGAVAAADPAGAPITVHLSPSTGTEGTRLLVLPVDGSNFLTVELLPAEGYNGHLPATGIAVHLVTLLGGHLQAIVPQIAPAPYTRLMGVGDSAKTFGWRIAVAADWKVTVTPRV
jgi:hypothetical protein